MKRPYLLTILLSAAFIAAYWGTSLLGTAIGRATNYETSLWGGAGLCLFAAFTFGKRLLPAIVLATFGYALSAHVSAVSALSISFSVTVAAYAASALLNRFHFQPNMARASDSLAFMLAGLLPNALVACLIGAPLLVLSGGAGSLSLPGLIQTWGVGSLLGAVWTAPLLFVWSSSRPHLPKAARLVELASLTSALLLFLYMFFSPDFLELRKDLYLIRPHTLFPFFVWTTLRFRQQGAATLGFVTGLVLVVAITTGNAPYDTLSAARNFDYLQNFISMLSLTSLFLGAAVCQFDETRLSLTVSERSAWEREKEFRAVFEFSGAGHARLDPATGRFVLANRKLCEILGYEPRELLEKTFADITYSPDLGISRLNFHTLSSGEGNSTDFEKRYVRKDGKVVWVWVAATLIRDKHDKPLSIIAVMQDVTNRKGVEDEQRKAKEAADAANLSKSQFVANMSHEIRTPLGAILGFNEFSFDANQTWEDRIHCAEKIQENGELLKRVIDDVLDLSKVEAGRFEVQRTRFPLDELLEGVYSLLRLKAAEKGLEVEVRSDGPVPRFVHSDPVRLRQILINVAGNSLKFTEKGKVTVTVRDVAATGNGTAQLEFEVEDTGIGITDVQASRIFQPFQQGDATMTRRYGGSGLGLALARNFAEALGGDLNLTRTSPVGTTFTCRIESGASAGQESYLHRSGIRPPPRRGAASTLPGDRLKGRRILVADDAPDNRALIRRFLEREGAIVEQAENGQEAVDMASAASYDVVLLDIQMPLLDGIAATRQLRAQGYVRPILALTAHAMREDRARTLDAGCNDHIPKPIDPRTLIAAVERFATPPA